MKSVDQDLKYVDESSYCNVTCEITLQNDDKAEYFCGGEDSISIYVASTKLIEIT